MATNENEKQVQERISSLLVKNMSMIITAIGVIIVGYFTYNQSTKDKLTDLKIERIRIENNERIAANNRHLANIYGEMFNCLYRLDADRCFIIQPHPVHRHTYMSVVLEVDRNGVSPVKDIFQNIPMSDMAGFVKLLGSNNQLYFDNPLLQVEDRRALSIMLLSGSMQIAIYQLTDVNNNWIGSIVVENINIRKINLVEAFEVLKMCANTIQFILPPIN